ncbi:unnamed protein product, partial [Mesorhabditis spiculigera]
MLPFDDSTFRSLSPIRGSPSRIDEDSFDISFCELSNPDSEVSTEDHRDLTQSTPGSLPLPAISSPVDPCSAEFRLKKPLWGKHKLLHAPMKPRKSKKKEQPIAPGQWFRDIEVRDWDGDFGKSVEKIVKPSVPLAPFQKNYRVVREMFEARRPQIETFERKMKLFFFFTIFFFFVATALAGPYEVGHDCIHSAQCDDGSCCQNAGASEGHCQKAKCSDSQHELLMLN